MKELSIKIELTDILYKLLWIVYISHMYFEHTSTWYKWLFWITIPLSIYLIIENLIKTFKFKIKNK